MEDGVIESESFLHPNKEEQQKEDHNNGRGADQDTQSPGLLNQIVSTLLSKVESESDSEYVEKEEKSSSEEEKKGNGILDNIISHLVSPKPAAEDGTKPRDDEVKKTGEEEGGGSGGIIDNIISHFPTSLPDDAVPTTDEASILIHSIVHD